MLSRDETNALRMNDNRARWERVKRLFQSALERAPEDRERFLREACQGDQVLLLQVESLLVAHQEAGAFAERPAIEAFAAAKAETAAAPGLSRLAGVLSAAPLDQARFIPGTMVADRYRLVALLGCGGMGVRSIAPRI